MTALTRPVLVTGASSGIGAAVCRRLAGPGTGILVHARANEAGAEAVAAEVRERGGEAETYLADLADPSAPLRLVEATVRAFGGLSVLVSNAGLADRRLPGADLDVEGYAQTHRITAEAFLGLVNAATPHLKKAERGRVIALGAFNSHLFRPDITQFPASGAAKAAVEVLARALAVELAPDGVTVNCVAPGLIRKDDGRHSVLTPEQWRALCAKVPVGRLGEPDEVAAVIEFLAGPDSGYVTGQVWHVNGGLL